ncbi:thioesterase II family protein [Fibrella aquatilis]|uniref:Thioesterase n=1 Tax=Fibrella aquatilis TaxID=2817059 RepID=A0A939GAD3_9BACT|nr:alpha/beta fold hydrolase [Fibrella aquatilis]MBO0932991.1 thioesterase [Fibrella aquatilis]
MCSSTDPLLILALPYAGGSRHAYRAIERLSPNGLTWRTLELPGRGNRQCEPCLQTIPTMVNDLLAQASRYIDTQPYLLFGHSLGALLVYELARQISREARLPMPLGLVITGRAAPTVGYKRGLGQLSSPAFWATLDGYGGLPAELATCPDLQAFYEPTMRADIQALESYQHQPTAPLTIPLLVRAGDTEGISRTDLVAWQTETTCPLDAGFMPGNHFFILNHPAELLHQCRRLAMSTYAVA